MTPKEQIAELEAKLAAATSKTGFQNCTMDIDNNILTITVDLTKDMGLSKSLKSINIGSTGGGQKIPGADATINLNIYRKNPDYVKPAKAA